VGGLGDCTMQLWGGGGGGQGGAGKEKRASRLAAKRDCLLRLHLLYTEECLAIVGARCVGREKGSTASGCKGRRLGV